MTGEIKILLVEDSKVDAAHITGVLKSGGINFQVHRVETAESFQKALDEEKWDIVLSDYSLPQFDGLSALRIVRAQQADLPVIMVSGKRGEEFAVEVMRAGAQDFLVKGNLSRLVSAINREVKQRREKSQELRSVSARMETLIEMVPDRFFYMDSNGYYRMVNDKYADFYGVTKEEIIGKCAAEFMPPELLKKSIESNRVTLETAVTTRYEGQFNVCGKMTFWDVIKVPLFNPDDGKIIGILGVSRDITEKKQTELALLEGQRILAERNVSLQRAWEQTVAVLAQTAEAKDPYTAGHQTRVADLAVAIAQALDLDEERTQGLRMSAMLHDIGKIKIPGELLSKPGALSAQEMELIKTHSHASWTIMSLVDLPWNLAEIIYQHHERLDGSGYPRQLKEDEILLEAKIVSVADVVEAMMSHRPYRAALGIDKALEEIKQGSGELYDPQAVDTCVRLFEDNGFKFLQ